MLWCQMQDTSVLVVGNTASLVTWGGACCWHSSLVKWSWSFHSVKRKTKRGGGKKEKGKKKNSTSRNLPQQTIVRVGRRVSNQGDRGENRKYLIREIPKNKQAANWQQINFKIKKGEHQLKYLKSGKGQNMQQIWKLQSTKIRKSVAMKEHNDKRELKPWVSFTMQ